MGARKYLFLVVIILVTLIITFHRALNLTTQNLWPFSSSTNIAIVTFHGARADKSLKSKQEYASHWGYELLVGEPAYEDISSLPASQFEVVTAVFGARTREARREHGRRGDGEVVLGKSVARAAVSFRAGAHSLRARGGCVRRWRAVPVSRGRFRAGFSFLRGEMHGGINVGGHEEAGCGS
ncbi:hypothetical protein BC936DRAFT_141254 [Jimgerdemannia flammicorona]|uniref:Uncharacterized protein n=1 Tax=Jimgerdemannia flammicorona TaxID=994334 RepID=A0A433DG94_9FUNG|nr:hypothetical protein BC936DRAFT_141254 [Jimgerdemannia flammicorona]